MCSQSDGNESESEGGPDVGTDLPDIAEERASFSRSTQGNSMLVAAAYPSHAKLPNDQHTQFLDHVIAMLPHSRHKKNFSLPSRKKIRSCRDESPFIHYAFVYAVRKSDYVASVA